MSAPEALTYDSLVLKIQGYAERNDAEFVAEIPGFVMLAEQRLALEAKGLGFVRVVEFSFTPGNPVQEKPQRWRQTKSLYYQDAQGEIVYLLPRKYEYCKMYSSGLTLGDPKYYADVDYNHFYFAPAPVSAYAGELSYYERPEPLSETNQTNWTTRNVPQLLLYACLLEAQPYLKNTQMLSLWQAQYAEIIASLQREEANYNHDTTEAGK